MIHVLVTSSRTWQDYELVWQALDLAVHCSTDKKIKLTHGDAKRGGDRYARRWAEKHPDSVVYDPHPADWDTYGKRAGFIRNEEMVSLGPDIALAFVNDCVKKNCDERTVVHLSHGAAMTIDLCEFEDIPVEQFWQPLPPPPVPDGMGVTEYVADLDDMVKGRERHADHTQEKVGRCLYCSCGMRVQVG